MYTLKIKLKPRWGNDTVQDMEYFASVEAGLIKNEGPALDYPIQAFNYIVPFPEHDSLVITDDLGNVPYKIAEASNEEYTAAEYVGIYFDRPVQGTLKWSYRLYPRVLPDEYRSSPYLDFRNEPFGLNGSAWFSFILPKFDGKINVSLDWDMGEMPEGARAIWSYGEGHVEHCLSAWDIRFSMFQVGVMGCYEKDTFGVYWFGEPNFEVIPASERLEKVFRYMKEYFHDPDTYFRVFLRRDPFEISNGGTAVPHAFISGYSAFGGMNADRWYNVLVHEMTHYWPYMEDKPLGSATWFMEGATEYYCTVLPYRAGIADDVYTLDCLNLKSKERYWDNPYREVPNKEIPEVQWKDRQAQTVPYGRGFVYLANVDKKLRDQGKGSLDDLVIGHSMENPLFLEDYLAFIKERLGDEGLREFEDMQSGKLVVPDDGIFGTAFKAVQEEIVLDGKQVISYRWELAE